jgi:hypothetical protein
MVALHKATGSMPVQKANVFDWDEDMKNARSAFMSYEKGNPYWDKVGNLFLLHNRHLAFACVLCV